MKELKILAVLAVLVGITYYGIEPYAHHEMHPPVAPADFTYDGKSEVALYTKTMDEKLVAAKENVALQTAELAKATDAKTKEDITKKLEKAKSEVATLPETAKAEAQRRSDFWKTANDTAALAGNAANGKVLVDANCIACHGIDAAGMPMAISNADAAASYGVVPPDLSNSGTIYDTKYLAAFIASPVDAMHIQEKFSPESGKTFPMPAYNWMQPQEIADVVAYLKSLPVKKLEGKEAHKATFEAACGRCHSMQYSKFESPTPVDALKTYMGTTPPDLSQYIKSRGEHYLHDFINDPQALLAGTSMPRVGLTEVAQHDVIAYMEEIGDPKKDERISLGIYTLAFTLVFAILGYLWKRKIWSEVH